MNAFTLWTVNRLSQPLGKAYASTKPHECNVIIDDSNASVVAYFNSYGGLMVLEPLFSGLIQMGRKTS